jgi:hypothetical protein
MDAVCAALEDIKRAVQAQDGRRLATLLSTLDPAPLAPAVASFCGGADREGRVEAAAHDLVGERWGPIAVRAPPPFA